MDGFDTANTDEFEEEQNSRGDRSGYHDQDTDEIQPLQPPDKESTQLTSQTQPISDQSVAAVESVYCTFGEEELGSYDTAVLSRQANGALQDQVDDEVHSDHQQSVKSEKRGYRITQISKVLEQDTSCKGEFSSLQLEGDKAAIPQRRDGSIQVRIDDGTQHRSDMMGAESGVACVRDIFEDNVSVEEIHGRPHSSLLVTGRPGGHFKAKTPVHHDSPFSVQIPSPGIQTKLLVFERRFPSAARNETSISVHFLDSQVLNEMNVCELVSRMEEQPGTKLVQFCVEHVGLQTSSRYFHTAYIQDQVAIRFQLNPVQRHFRLKDASIAEKIITVPQITSLSQRWMELPGAKAEVYVESQCEDGQLCEDHLRINLQYGDTALTLLPSIWSCGHNDPHSSLKK